MGRRDGDKMNIKFLLKAGNFSSLLFYCRKRKERKRKNKNEMKRRAGSGR